MNKEQILGRLLMNGHITMDELNLLGNEIVKGNSATSAVIKKMENKELKPLTEWLKEFRNNTTTIDAFTKF